MTSRKPFKFATQSEKPGLSSSISLETVAPEALQFEKINKNEPNSQTLYFGRGISPYRDLGGTLGLRRGCQKPQKTTFQGKKCYT